jgi:hypothetical protein
LGWGVGVGIGFNNLVTKSLSDARYKRGTEFRDASLDISDWEGVSLWARRGPEGQPLLRVLVGDKYTDDDLSFLSHNDPTLPRYCERVKECACLNGKPCTIWGGGASDAGNGASFNAGSYCGDPAFDPPPGTINQNGQQATNTCGMSHCNEDYPAYPGVVDKQFNGKPCNPFTVRDGTPSLYCFDPVFDPPPAQPDQRCGDHWTFPLHLTTDWQFFRVPFTEMFQQGFAQKAPTFDLTSVSAVRLTWNAGSIDFWIDDVSFYRAARK